MSRCVGRDYKDTDESIAYTHDYTADLNGSTISSVTWSVTPSDLTTDATSNTTTTASIRVSSGTPGQLYKVESTALLASSEKPQAHHEVQVLN